MTFNPYSQIVLDTSALAAADLPFALQAKTLRTAVHVGVRWISCPTGAAQTLAGRALFDLPKWRSIAPLAEDDTKAAIFAASVRLRRNRIDLLALPHVRCPAARIAREAVRDGSAGGAALGVADAAELLAALRFPGAQCVQLGDSFDSAGWRDPSIPAILTARRGVDVFASERQAGIKGVTGFIHAPDSPRALFRLLRTYRPRWPSPLPGLAEAA